MVVNGPVRKAINRSLSVGLLLLAAACESRPAPQPAPTPRPDPTVVAVYLDGELDPMRPALSACSAAQEGVALLVFLRDDPAAPEGAEKLHIHLGYTQDGWEGDVYLLGYESIVAVVPQDSPFESLTRQELRSAFSGEMQAGQTEMWAPLPGTAAEAALLDLMKGTALDPDTFLAPNPEAALEGLANNPSAIAVIPESWLTEDVRAVLKLTDVPILAETAGEAGGAVRHLLGCLQRAGG